MDMRVMKIEYLDVNHTSIKYTYYSYDAQGNVMATYDREITHTGTGTYDDQLILAEQMIYGSGRIGTDNRNLPLVQAAITQSSGNVSAELRENFVWSIGATPTYDQTLRVVGHRVYELSNHLGNVLEVITDRKIEWDDNGTWIYTADVVSYSDYYPYGQLLDGRTGSQGDDYRYGFQGQELDDEVGKGHGNSINYKYRMHDPRVGRFFAVDPLAPKYPHNSPYAFSENVVINAVELEGLEKSVIINNSVDGGTPKEPIVQTAEQIKKDKVFGPIVKMFVDEGLVDDNTDLHLKAQFMYTKHQKIDGTILSVHYWRYEVTWLSTEDDDIVLRSDLSIPVGATYYSGQRLSDYLLALVGSGFYASYFKWAVTNSARAQIVLHYTTKLSGKVNEWAKTTMNSLETATQKAKFNTATVVYDKTLKKYFFGRNKGIQIKGDEIHPQLKKMLPEESLNNYKLGNCAECDAVNQALHAGSKVDDLKMYTVGVRKDGTTFAKPQCENCQQTFQGIEDFTNQ